MYSSLDIGFLMLLSTFCSFHWLACISIVFARFHRRCVMQVTKQLFISVQL